MLETRIRDFFTATCPTHAGDTLVAAVSGGPDSVALLHLLVRVQDTLGVTLQIAHLNHGIRGQEADEDAEFVAELAGELGLTLHRRRVDVPGIVERERGSLEAVARRERHRFLQEARAVAGARWVVTGHTADDQVGTFLINMMRGAGPRGLGGMLPVGPGPICRPLLTFWREEILAFLEEEDLPYRMDTSNADTTLMRNRIREVLVPFLGKEFGPNIRTVLARESQLMNELDDYLSLEGARILRGATLEEGATASESEVRLAIPKLVAYHRVLQRSVIRAAIEELVGGLEEISYTHVDAILELLDREGGSARVDLPRGLTAGREYDTLVLALSGSLPGEYAAPEPSPPLALGRTGEFRWGAFHLKWFPLPTVEVDALEWASRSDRCSFDADELVPPVYVRGVRSGDRLEPLGMDGSQKVSDLLINRKVPRRLRTRIALLCDNGGPEDGERILWVAGHRRSSHAAVTSETSQVVLFEAETMI